MSIAAPAAALADSTPVPDVTPAPQRAPALVGSPSPPPRVQPTTAPAPPLPTPTPPATLPLAPASVATVTAQPTPTAEVTSTSISTPAPDRFPAAADASPSPSPAEDAATPESTDTVEAAVDWRAYVPTDVADHLATMDRAARDSNCGVPWQLLAGIARVESDFGRNMATSSAGAVGYGQFLPSSWQAYGNAGNVYDYRDALPAIAQYLCQAGLERDPRSALYAYNHADWYVDLVLDLAVRYDRMAPGGPTPDILNVDPAQQNAAPMQYADGRDLRSETHARTVNGAVRWLGVPWRGRTAGQPISAAALETTTLTMLRQNIGGRGDVAAVTDAGGSDNLDGLSGAAWDVGLLALPESGPQWTTGELRAHLRLGQPVVVYVSSRGLPGHPPGEDIGEQPLLLIGSTQNGFVYSDPTFASSLGYGLQITDTDLLSAWDAATRPRQALAFVPRPRPPALQAHIAQADPPDTIARVVPTETAVAIALRPTDAPTLEQPTPTPLSTASVDPAAATTPAGGNQASLVASPPADWSWTVLLGLAAVSVGTLAVRLWRARRLS